MGRNEDSLLRAVGEKSLLASATRGGSCAHPDQSRGLALWHKLRAISVSEHLLLILPFFLGGGVALHERLVGRVDLWLMSTLGACCSLANFPSCVICLIYDIFLLERKDQAHFGSFEERTWASRWKCTLPI